MQILVDIGLFRYSSFFNKTEPLRVSTSDNMNVDRNSTVLADETLADDAKVLSEKDTDSEVELMELSTALDEPPHDEQETLIKIKYYIVNIKQVEKGCD